MILETRFLPPERWEAASFTNPDTNHKLHYGFVSPPDPKAVVVCLSGLSEFSEKYFEVAHDMVGRGYAFWIMDWQYQGRSSRLGAVPQRRHSDGFETDVSDLLKFVNYIVKTNGRPLIMLGHSMGGNIGLRFLAQHPDVFSCAAFSSPFLGIFSLSIFSKLLLRVLTPIMPFIKTRYVFGSTDWREAARKADGFDIFSCDPVRDRVHNYWSKNESVLQVGGPTFGWIRHALKSCTLLSRKQVLESIKIPVLIATAGKEMIVDNSAIRAAAAHIPQAQLLEIKGARHEIFMECDEYRDVFFKAFDKMVEDNKITGRG